MLEAGKTFGRYVIEALLGQGGMGEVYRAQDTRLHRRVALKILRAPGGDESDWDDASARMLREARAAAAFEHPNAVHIYDFGAVDGTPFIAMEYVPGKTLREFAASTTLPWELTLRMLLDVASALGAAHDAGLVHRDVKPSNVMVRDDGRVKVLDFGIARRASGAPGGSEGGARDSSVPTITAQGIVLGTLSYMPPEQLAGRPVDGRADQFAWGVMAYQLLAQRLPWSKHPDVLAMMTAILSEPPTPLGSLAPLLPEPVTAAIHRTLAREASDRFASMTELLQALEPYAAPATGYVSSPHAARNLASVPALPVSDSGVRTPEALAATAALAPEASRRATSATAPAGASRGWLLAGGAAAVLALGVGGTLALSQRGGASPAAPQVTGPASPAPSSSGAGALTLLGLPAPSSTVPSALTAYREGVQAEHDANKEAARQDFLRASLDDPGLGAAHLRYALLEFWDDVTTARTHFSKAQQLRSGLGVHEQALLDAVAPLFDENPSDWGEAEQKLARACERRPEDVELRHWLGWVQEREGKLPEALATQDAALALDPTYAAALHARVQTLQLAGDVPGTLKATRECLRVSPTATDCLNQTLWTYNQEGRCTDFVRDAQRITAIDPDNSQAYEDLGQGSLALGRPPEAVWEFLRLGWKRAAPADAAWLEALDRAQTDALLGDLPALGAALATLHRVNADRSDQWSHFCEAVMTVGELTELGQLDRAAQAADDLLRHKDALVQDPGIDAWTLAADGVPFLLKALERAGKIGPAELQARRAAWMAGWRRRLTPGVAPYLWVYGYADIVETAAEAAEALAAQPATGPIPPYRPVRMADAHIGRTYLLAGRLDEAVDTLRRASSQCQPFEDPFAWVRAKLWLGEALEAKGQTEEACAAFRSVEQRWAGFGARSVSVAEARAHRTGLRCAR